MSTKLRTQRQLLVPVSFVLTSGVMLLNPSGASAQWPQWGGPDRNFSVDVSGLAERWPADGPKRLWTRPLGDGYSTIVAEGGILYTMYRAGDNELTVALDAKTGKTIWQYSIPAPVTDAVNQGGMFSRGRMASASRSSASASRNSNRDTLPLRLRSCGAED